MGCLKRSDLEDLVGPMLHSSRSRGRSDHGFSITVCTLCRLSTFAAPESWQPAGSLMCDGQREIVLKLEKEEQQCD